MIKGAQEINLGSGDKYILGSREHSGEQGTPHTEPQQKYLMKTTVSC